MKREACLAMLVVLSVVLATSDAMAQNALGAGDVLDANLSRTGGRRNLPAQGADYRARNLLITGNVAGGRQFRDSVGYAAVGDFLGELGSDDYYEFRAGSAFSALSYVNAGHTYDRLRFGRQLDLIEYPRAGYGSTIRRVQELPYPGRQLSDAQLWTDRVSRAISIESLVEESAQSAISGRALIVDQTGQPSAQYFLNVSSLRGVFLSDSQQHLQFWGLSEYEKAELVADSRSETSIRPVGTEFMARATDLVRESDQVASEPMDARLDLERAPDYKRIIERIVARYADSEQYDMRIDEHILKELDIDLEELRSQLAQADTDQGMQAALPPLEEGSSEDAQPQLPDGVISPVEEETEEDEGDDERKAPGVPSTERLSMALRHGEMVRTLTGAEQDRLNRLMALAEQDLREGEYFWAERRFERAWQFAPNHPLAAAGMGHAQLGAGFYLSASLTLRKMLTAHPEMIDTRYEEGLIPERQRLLTAVEYLRGKVDLESTNRGSDAFLLAYIGHQLQDRTLVELGLNAMAEASPSDPLHSLLESIWLAPPDEDEDAGEAQEPPDEAADEEAGQEDPEPEK